MQVTGAPRTTHLALSRKGDRLLANCSDRVARIFDIAAPGVADPPRPFGTEAAVSRIRTQKVAYLPSSVPSSYVPSCILVGNEVYDSIRHACPWLLETAQDDSANESCSMAVFCGAIRFIAARIEGLGLMIQ